MKLVELLSEKFDFNKLSNQFYGFNNPVTDKDYGVIFAELGDDVYDVSFGPMDPRTRGISYELHDAKGSELSIMRTVINVIKDFLKNNPNTDAIVGVPADDKKDKRARMYHAAFNKLAKELGGQVYIDKEKTLEYLPPNSSYIELGPPDETVGTRKKK